MKKLLLLFAFLSTEFIVQSQTRFIWPLKKMPAYSEVPDYYSINNFVDQNPGTGTRDWNCGNPARTYNAHTGIDIDLWPFYWNMMNNNYVAVVAAAPGRVAAVVDNINNENNCGQPGENQNWNYIAIQHANGTSIYGHIRTSSARVRVGQTVVAGEIIAFVGSSGNSSNPHLHFEVNSGAVLNSTTTGLIDPFSGGCNSLNTNSWWLNQQPYWNPAVLRVMTHVSRPFIPGYKVDGSTCPGYERINAKNAFVGGDSLYISIALRDFRKDASYKVTVFTPNWLTWLTETVTNTDRDKPKYFHTLDKKLPRLNSSGTYKVLVEYNNTRSVHFFSIDCPASAEVNEELITEKGFKVSGSITSKAKVLEGGSLLLQAGTSIRLTNGFKASKGTKFTARIRDCNYSE